MTLPESLTTIETNAFYNCTALLEIMIPDSVTFIGEKAFYNCNNLSEIHFPEKLENIEEYAFAVCTSLVKAELPENLEKIGDYAFTENTSLKNVKLPDSLKWLGYRSFYNCPMEEKETYENGVVALGTWVTGYSGTADDVIIPDGIIGIAAGAFTGAENIISLTLPESLKYICDDAFDACYNLKNLTVNGEIEYVGDGAFTDTAWYNIEDGYLTLGTCLLRYNGSGAEFTLPETITVIGKEAFAGAEITTLIIPESVTEIREGAFRGSAITSIHYEGNEDMTFMEAVEKFGSECFRGMALTTAVTESWYEGESSSVARGIDGTSIASLIGRKIARSLIENGEISNYKDAYDWLCSNCGYTLDTGDHYSYADGPFFYGYASCQGVALAYKAFLDELQIPNFILTGQVTGAYGTLSHAWNVACVGGDWYHFDASDTQRGDYSTYKMTDYYASNTMQYVWNETTYDNRMEEALDAYESGEYAGDSPLTFTKQSDGTYWVTDCAVKEKEVVIPDSYNGIAVTGIGKRAFENCSWLETIVIPEGIETIGEEAFLRCIALKKAELPSTVSEIGEGAFQSCISLESSDFSQSAITEVPDVVFMGCVSLKNLSLSYYVTSISSAFAYNGTINRLDGSENYNILAPEGSDAQIFAEKNNYTFISTGKHIHDMEKTAATAATCTVSGNIEYYTCKSCGRIYMDENGITRITASDTVEAATGHSWKSEYTIEKEATCTTAGSKSIHCSECDIVKSGSLTTIPAKGHTAEVDKGEEATCETSGKTDGSHCSVCGEVIVPQKEILPLGHNFVNYASDGNATCLKDGTKTAKCDRCDKTDTVTDEGSASGHKWNSGSVTKATTSVNGKKVYTCNKCGEKKSTVIYYPKTIKLSTTSYTYNGKEKKPSVTVKGSDGKVISSSNYTVTYASGRKNVGKYKVTIKFKGNYSGTVIKYFKIKPKGTSISSLTKESKAFTVKWKKQSTKMSTSRITGYQIQYSTSKTFASNVKTKTVSGYSKISKKITGLKAKKTYYVRVRTYKTVSGTKYYSSWSAIKSVKTK